MSNTFPKTVLHIDDDPDDRELIREAIQEADGSFHLHQERSGKGGLAYLMECKAGGRLPCLIILDVNMPEMDGRETSRLIKADAELAHIPLIIFTTSQSLLDREYFARKGIRMLTKPSTLKELRLAVGELLHHCPPS